MGEESKSRKVKKSKSPKVNWLSRLPLARGDRIFRNLRFQDSDKFIMREIGLPKHPMKQWGRNISTMLMANSYLENYVVRKDFFPGLVLFRSNQQKPRFLQDCPEVRIGKWHPSGKEGLHIVLRSHLVDGSNKQGVWRTIGAFAEPLILFHILFSVIDGHLNEVLEGGLRGIPLCGKIKFRADDDVSSLGGFNNRCQRCGAFFQDDGHNPSCIKEAMKSKGGKGPRYLKGVMRQGEKVQGFAMSIRSKSLKWVEKLRECL